MAKIIAATKDGYLVDISHDEVANLVGFYTHYSRGVPKLGPGDIIKIHNMYQRLYQLEAAQGTLNQHAKELERIADYFRSVVPVVPDGMKVELGQ